MNMISKPMISWLEQSKTCTESIQRHRVQHQDHSQIQLMEAREEDSEDKAMEEALHEEKVFVMVAAQLLVTTAEL